MLDQSYSRRIMFNKRVPYGSESSEWKDVVKVRYKERGHTSRGVSYIDAVHGRSQLQLEKCCRFDNVQFINVRGTLLGRIMTPAVAAP